MSEEQNVETNDGTWSGLKKTIIGVASTAVMAGGTYFTTTLFGGHDKEETNTEQVAPAAAPVINLNVDNSSKNMANSGGGATTTAIGVVGGLLEAGVRPVILESNHQDEDDVLKLSDCKIDPRTERWLSRTRRYHLLADLVQEEDQKHALRALYSALSLDWSAFSTEAGQIQDPKLRAKIRELDIPRNGAQPLSSWISWTSHSSSNTFFSATTSINSCDCGVAYNIVRCSVQYGQMFENSKNKEFF